MVLITTLGEGGAYPFSRDNFLSIFGFSHEPSAPPLHSAFSQHFTCMETKLSKIKSKASLNMLMASSAGNQSF